MGSHSVKIGREFFSKAFNDYADRYFAFSRELLQNCLDAPGCTTVRVTIATIDGNTVVTAFNDGAPMTEDVLFGKLLTLGGSGKNFAGTTGGFGKAKECLYLTHVQYMIETGEFSVTGSGGDYDTETLDPPLSGTRSTVTWEGDVTDRLIAAFRRFAQLAKWNGRIVLNGEELPTALRTGYLRREFPWAKVFTNKQHSGLVVVRINGCPMFTRETSFKGCVIVELTGTSGDRLTSNRDSLRWESARELDAFLANLAVDKRSALRQQKAEYLRFEGERQKAEAARPKSAGSLADAFNSIAALVGADAQRLSTDVRPGINTITIGRQDVPVTCGLELIVKNTTGKPVPAQYTPGPKFSPYARNLIFSWARVLVELHRIDNRSTEFSVGFVLDNESIAEFSTSRDYGTVYYLNPTKVENGKLVRRFKTAFNDRHLIISYAIHEYCHMNNATHDEDFASEITRVTGLVLENHARIYKAYKGKKTR